MTIKKISISQRAATGLSLCALLGSVSVLAQTTQQGALRLYRYTNEKGVVVTGSQIDPESAKKGYKIIDLHGKTLENIAPTPSTEQRAVLEAAYAEKTESDKKDALLLVRYSSLHELESTHERQRKDGDSKIKKLENSAASLQKQVKEMKAKAIEAERNGGKASADIAIKLDSLNQTQSTTQKAIEEQTQENKTTEAAFIEDIARYKRLGKEHKGKATEQSQ